MANRSTLPGHTSERIATYADMFSAIGTEARLRIMRLLLSAHPDGLVVSEIQEELEIPNSTLSHHLDKLKTEDLVNVQRESTFLRYTANTEALQELAAVPLCRMLHPEQSRETANHRTNLQIGAIHEHYQTSDIKEVVKENMERPRCASPLGAVPAAARRLRLRLRCCDPITADLYDASQIGQIPEEAVLASLGCGNPTALAN